jgi:hypothetical protein
MEASRQVPTFVETDAACTLQVLPMGPTALGSSELPRKWSHHVIAYEMKSKLVEKAGDSRITSSICGVACVCRPPGQRPSTGRLSCYIWQQRFISWIHYCSARETHTLSYVRWPHCALPRVSTAFDACVAIVAPIRLGPCRQLYCAFYPREFFI